MAAKKQTRERSQPSGAATNRATSWDRESYLKDRAVAAFIEYFTAMVGGRRDLNHSYKIKSKTWIARRRTSELHLKTFVSAFESYFWLTPEDERDDETDAVSRADSDRASFDTNQGILNGLSDDLKAALESNDHNRVFVQCIRILDWGQVYRGSVKWVLEQHGKGTLTKALRRGVAILDGKSLKEIEEFDGSTLRMDSGLTKIFSLASRQSIIYDDRVGASIGLLVRRFLDEYDHQIGVVNGHAGKPEKRRVPETLRFMRSNRKSRNPSKGSLKFPSRSTKPSLNHARSNLMANWVINAVSDKLGQAWPSRKLEAALFMIGYDVSA